MFTVFLEHKFLAGAIFIFLLLSIICQIAVGVIYHGMIQEAGNMSTTENKLLKQCKLKYTNCYKLNGRLVNTSVFVDKFMQRIGYARFSLVRLTHISGQLMMLSVVVTGVAVCLSLAAGDTLFQIIPYYLSSILGLYFYFSISGVVDIQGKRNMLKTNLVDYLENHLAPRLEIELAQALEEGEKKREKTYHFKEELAADRKDGDEKAVRLPDENVEELEELLKEFFA